jgi:hypothetical protein
MPWAIGRAGAERYRSEDWCQPRNLGAETQSCNFSKRPVLEKPGERTHLACCFRHLAGNVSQRVASRGATKHSGDVEVLMAVRRKQMLPAFPPDHPARRYPTLTRLGLVQRWTVLEIPAGDQLRTGAGASRWFLGDHLKRSVEVLPRRGWGYKSNVDELPASLRWVWVLEVLTPKELWRSERLSHSRFLGRH